MIKKILIIILASFAICNTYAQTNIEISQEKIIENGQKFYLHTVQQGQTLYSICKAYSVSEKEVLNVNSELQTGTLSIGQIVKIPIENEISKDGKYIVYLVKKSETLYSLLKRFEVSENEFYQANPKISRSKSLKAGDEIYFPIKEKSQTKPAEPAKEEKPAPAIVNRDDNKYIYHTVEKGETLYRLTKKYEISLDEIVAENPELANRSLSVGETIRIPKKQESAVAQQQTNEVIKEEPKAEIPVEIEEEYPDSIQELLTTDKKEFTVTLLMSFDKSANIRDLINQEKKKTTQKLRAATLKAIDFYSGCLVALENFKNEDIKINFNVYDIGKDNSVLTTMIAENKFKNVDMIIGPAFKSQADFLNSQKLDIPMLLPFVTDESIVISNPNNIILNPSKRDVLTAVAQYAKQIENCNVIIVKNNSDESASQTLKYSEEMQALNVRNTTLDFDGTNILSIGSSLKKDAENLIILTFYNEMAVSRALSQVFKLCEDNKISLIADPKIMNYENLDPNYYTEVKYTYCSGNNVNYESQAVKSFISNFRSSFLCEPNTDAYLAADAINYFIPLLQQYGKNFIKRINQDEIYEGLGGDKQYINRSDYAKNSHSNKMVYIYKIEEDYSFKQVFPAVETNTDKNK